MTPSRFSLPSRLFHWVMAPLLLTMLFVGVGMVSTVSSWRPWLLDFHKPLGLALFVLAVLRLFLRLKGGTPALPASMPGWQKLIAKLSHWVLYGCMLAMPLLGWSMLSAAGYPLPGVGGWHLPPIAPQSVELYAVLRAAHGIVGKLFFLTILAHISAGLLHALVLKDGVFGAMSLGDRNR